MRFGERIYTLLRISILSYQDYKNIISSLWGDFIFWVKSPLTNVLLGKAAEGCILGACRQGICFVPAILVLPAVWELNGVLYAQPIADAASALIAAVMAVRLHRELRAAEAQASID